MNNLNGGPVMKKTILKSILSASLLIIGIMASANADDCEWIREKLKTESVVNVPAGTYVCSSPIVLDRDGTSLKGAGPGKTIFKLADHANAPLVVIGDVDVPRPVKNISVSGFTADGNMANQEVECWNSASCDGPERNQVRNNGITIRGASDINVEDVELMNARSGGMVTERVCRRLHVKNVDAHHNYFDGFAGYLTEDSDFTNLKLHHHVHGSGISLDLQFNKNIFKNVDMYNNNDNGIFMRESNVNTFEDIIIRDNGNFGVFGACAWSNETCVSKNVFRNLIISNCNKGKGFYITGDGCKDNVLENVRFSGNKSGDLSYEPKYSLAVNNMSVDSTCSDTQVATIKPIEVLVDKVDKITGKIKGSTAIKVE
jgi:hypothetical protein